jgi:predicted nucleic acid-binding protein
MPADRFLDTNILLYAYDLDAPAKRAVARAILEEALLQPSRTALSVQVLQEFHVNFVRNGHPVAEATLIVGDFTSWMVIENSLALFQRGLWLQSRWQISLWDAMILAAAESSGARELLSEDLNHGQNYGQVCVINPFLA